MSCPICSGQVEVKDVVYGKVILDEQTEKDICSICNVKVCRMMEACYDRGMGRQTVGR